ncbi:hypothetical protein Tco_0971528 [Tanacetum coccineum]
MICFSIVYEPAHQKYYKNSKKEKGDETYINSKVIGDATLKRVLEEERRKIEASRRQMRKGENFREWKTLGLRRETP